NFAFYSDNRFPRVTLGPKLPIAEITLHLGPPAARLVGKLRDSSDNSAVHGATITLCRIDHAGYCISTAPSLDDSKFDLLIPTSPIQFGFRPPVTSPCRCHFGIYHQAKLGTAISI